jgi:hypothetical protein
LLVTNNKPRGRRPNRPEREERKMLKYDTYFKMTKGMKKELLNAMINAGNYFYLRKVANALGIEQMSRAEAEGMMKAYLHRRPDMKAYYDDSNHNSFFCGLWFAEKSMQFDR